MKPFLGLFLSSGLLSVCFQSFSWVVRSESDTNLNVSWFNSYVGSLALILSLATLRTIFRADGNK